MMLEELQKVIPSFVLRVDRPERGGRWIEYLRDRERRARELAERFACGRTTTSRRRPSGCSASRAPRTI